MPTIDLNCDCGESFGAWSIGNDEAILPHVSSANIACGGHAGDPDVMRRTLRLAKSLGVSAGAHPGYPDLQGFGRRSMALGADEIENTVLAQIGALYALAHAEGATLKHVKPHGALANESATNDAVAQAIARAVASFDPQLVLVAIANSALEKAGRAAGLTVAREAYIDRSYEPDGTLRARRYDNALITDPQQSLEQALRIIQQGFLLAYTGEHVSVQAETICFHGDLPGAAERAAFVRAGLERAGIEVAPLGLGSGQNTKTMLPVNAILMPKSEPSVAPDEKKEVSMDATDAKARIAKAANGLLYSSESDYPLEPFTWTESTAFAPNQLYKLASLQEDASVTQESIDEFFAPMLDPRTGDSPEARKRRECFRKLVQVLKKNLRDLAVYKLGEVEMPTFIVGTFADGTIGGLRTTVVES